MAKLDVDGLFKSIDGMDADAFVGFLTDDATFRYGSQNPVEGKAAVREYVETFFGMIDSLSHNVEAVLEGENSMCCYGNATYVRQDGGEVTLPFANIFRLQGDKVKDYLVHIDPAPLFG
jgi:ketosteroid isomerase-like protein